MKNSSHHARGLTLIESLVGMAVLCLSLAGAVKMQGWLHQTSEASRQRSDAVRLAQQELEQLRHFTDRDSFNAVASREADSPAGATRFRLSRQIVDSVPHRKDAVIEVSWTDVRHAVQTVRLEGYLAGVMPVLAAALTVPSQDRTLAVRRHLPPTAVPWQQDRSRVPASSDGRISWIVDNTSGLVVSQCLSSPVPASINSPTAETTPLDRADCTPATGRLVRGYVRYALGAQPDPTSANDVPLPLTLTAPSAQCVTHRSAIMGESERHLVYHCLVHADDFRPEQLRLVPSGWQFGPTVSQYRACRYVSADGSPTALHNFLVVRGNVECPSTAASPPTPHNVASVHTVHHPT